MVPPQSLAGHIEPRSVPVQLPSKASPRRHSGVTARGHGVRTATARSRRPARLAAVPEARQAACTLPNRLKSRNTSPTTT